LSRGVRKTKHLNLLSLLIAILLVGCASLPKSKPATLNIFAAASLIEPFEEIKDLFEAAHPGVTVAFNFAGSQQLARQIIEGAPADVFASANLKQMQTVVEAGWVEDGSQQTFATNSLMVVIPKENPEDFNELIDLARPGLKLVFAAQEVPVGQYTLEFLDKASADPAFGSSYKDDVLKNVVSYEDNVKAVLAKVALGEADAGIVYASDISGGNAASVLQLEIPETLNVIASYPIAPLKDSQNLELAQAFIELVTSPEGQAILEKYHFTPPAR
jgi:molybdate transport system substrate-binding protein